MSSTTYTISTYKRAAKLDGAITTVIRSASDLRFAQQRTMQEISVLRANQSYYEHIERISTNQQNVSMAINAVKAMKTMIKDYRKLAERLAKYKISSAKPISLFPLNSDATVNVVEHYNKLAKKYDSKTKVGYRNVNRFKQYTPMSVPKKSIDAALADVKREFATFERKQKTDRAVPIAFADISIYETHLTDEILVLDQNTIIFETILERAQMEGSFVQQAKTVLSLHQRYVKAYKSSLTTIRRRPSSFKAGLARGNGIPFAKEVAAFFNNVMRRVTKNGNLSLILHEGIGKTNTMLGKSSRPRPMSTQRSTQSLRSSNQSPTGVAQRQQSSKSTSAFGSNAMRLSANRSSASSSGKSVYYNTNQRNTINAPKTIHNLRSKILQADLKIANLERQVISAKKQSENMQRALMNDGSRMMMMGGTGNVNLSGMSLRQKHALLDRLQKNLGLTPMQ